MVHFCIHCSYVHIRDLMESDDIFWCTAKHDRPAEVKNPDASCDYYGPTDARKIEYNKARWADIKETIRNRGK